MNELHNYLIQNIKYSTYEKDYDEEECIVFWEACATVNFNGEKYYTKYVGLKETDNFEEALYNKLLNKVVTNLGLQKLKEIFKK